MKIKYTTGPQRVTMGVAGTFFRGEPRDVPADLARQILAKPALKWAEEISSKTRKSKED